MFKVNDIIRSKFTTGGNLANYQKGELYKVFKTEKHTYQNGRYTVQWFYTVSLSTGIKNASSVAANFELVKNKPKSHLPSFL